MLTAFPALQVTRAAVLNDCTLFCAFSSQVSSLCPLCPFASSRIEREIECVHHGADSPVQECARYLETFKSFETKPADAIQACPQLSMHPHHSCDVHCFGESHERGYPLLPG